MEHENKIKSDLSKDELDIWELTMLLIDKSILEPIDLISLSDYCKIKKRYYDLFAAVSDLDDNGIIEGNKGQPYQHPLVGMCNKEGERCEKIEHKFGFNPNGRKINGYESKQKSKTESKLKKLTKPSKTKLG